MGCIAGAAGATAGPAARCAFAANGVKRRTSTKESDLRMGLPCIPAALPYTILDARALYNVTGVWRHRPPGRLRFPPNWGCAITERPWRIPGSKNQLREMSGAKRLRRPQAVAITRPKRPEAPGKMPRGFVRFARSGWSRGVASLSATSAVTICPARTTIDRNAV